jgi:hypothetical protein
LAERKKVYVVTGWVRRIKREEADSDWHVEITEEEDAIPVSTTCMIVENPNPMFAHRGGVRSVPQASRTHTLPPQVANIESDRYRRYEANLRVVGLKPASHFEEFQTAPRRSGVDLRISI